jgi:large subunit ribosomal protein L4
MKAQIIDTTGKKIDEVVLPSEVFEVESNPGLLAQYLRVYSHNQRQGTAKVQDRSQVSGTTAKVWKQKGTGRARHGSRKAPIFVGGGQAHGPRGTQNYSLSMPKVLKTQALALALTQKAPTITLIRGLEKLEAKTKLFDQMFKKINSDLKAKYLLVLDQPFNNVVRGTANLKKVKATQVGRLNAFEILNSAAILMTEASLSDLKSRYNTQTVSEPVTEAKTKSTKKTKSKTE